jgi:hypothetical protein
MLCSLDLTPAEDAKIASILGSTSPDCIKRAILHYVDLISAASSDEAKKLMCAQGLIHPRQLLHVAVHAFLNRPPFLSEKEESEFLKLCRRLVHDNATRIRATGNG